LTGLPRFGAGRVGKTHIWINCNSFLFYFLVWKNVITRETSLILAFKFEISAAWLCLELAGFGPLALRWYLLVTERILSSACSRLARSGIMVVSRFCRASIALLSALTFFPAVLSSVSVLVLFCLLTDLVQFRVKGLVWMAVETRRRKRRKEKILGPKKSLKKCTGAVIPFPIFSE